MDSLVAAGPGDTASHEVLLRTSDLTKSFGGVLAVDHVSVDIGRGESVDWWGQTEPARQRCSTASVDSSP